MPTITPIAKPASISDNNQPSQAAISARERAIARLVGQQAAPIPVSNPTSISPEEVGAINSQVNQQDEPEVTPVPEANLAATDGQSDTNETPAAASLEETKKPAEEKSLSSEYAILARKEKALRMKVQQQDAQIKAREQALKAREDALSQKDSQYSTGYISKDRLLNDTWNVLAEAGVSYEQVTQQALSAQSLDPQVRATIDALKNEIKELRGETAGIKQASQEQKTQAYQDAVQQITFEAKTLVSKDPAYESIKETGSVNEVVRLIERTFKEDGVLMSVEEACQAVEEELAEKLYQYTNKISKLKKRFEPQAQAAPSKPPGNAPAKSPQMKTLTNAVSTSRQLSARERAILAFKGELKS